MEYGENFERRRNTVKAKTKNEKTKKIGEFFRPTNLYDAIKPLILLNSIVNTGIIEFSTERRKRKVGSIYITLLTFMYCIIFYFSCEPYAEESKHRNTEVGRLTLQGQFYSNIFIVFGTVGSGILRSKYMENFLLNLETCAKMFEAMGSPNNYRRLVFSQIISIVVVVSMLAISSMLNIIVLYPSATSRNNLTMVLVTILCPIFITTFVDYTFFFWIQYLKFKFEQLNGLLRDMLTTTSESPQHKKVLRLIKNSKENPRSTSIYYAYQMNINVTKLKKAKKVHLQLIRSAKSITDAYGFHMLLSMTSSCIYIISIAFNIYEILYIGSSKAAYKLEEIVMIYWTIVFVMKTITLNNICAKTKIEAADTGDIICQLYEPSTSKEFRAEISDFTQQIIQNPLAFNICGFFEMDHAFTYGILGSVTTYLIIFIQFGETPSAQLFPDGTRTKSY